MGRLGTGWQLTKTSLRVLRKDKKLLLFPLISGIALLAILAGFLGSMFLAFGLEGMFAGSAVWVFVIGMVVFYVVAFFVAIFFNAAIIGAATIRLDGGAPTLSDGLRIAWQNVGRIFLWALFAATVAMVLRAIQQRAGWIGRIIVGLVGIAWSLATYFVVPVLIYEKLGPWAAVKRSAGLFKRTWGEAFVGGFSMGGIFFLLGLAGLLPLVVALYVGGTAAILAAVVVMFAYWVVLALVAASASSILVAALYRYANTGKVAEDFQDLARTGVLPTRQTYAMPP